MKRKVVSGLMVTLLFVGMLTLAFSIQPVKAFVTIYIRADGSVDPPSAPIQREGDLYTLTGNVASDGNGIVIERNNMTLDGAGHSLDGPGWWSFKGVSLYGRNNVTIENLTVKNFYIGIMLDTASNNRLYGNDLTSNDYGISLSQSSNNRIFQNRITSSSWIGIRLYASSNNNTILGNHVTSNNDGGITLSQSSNNRIFQNKATNNSDGIVITHSSNNNTAFGNIMTHNMYSIWLSWSSGNIVAENSITKNHYGIYDETSSHTTIVGNNITNNSGQGIYLPWGSTHFSVVGNNITNNYDGIYLSSRYSLDIQNHTISGNNIANNSRYGLHIWSSSGNTVVGNNIANNEYGIGPLSYSCNNTILGNKITSNSNLGGYLTHSWGNIMAENNIADNECGMYLFDSSENIIYHNNFSNNVKQVSIDIIGANSWDDGYPSGGNYWSDHTDLDLYCGSNQDLWSSDGIWDNPYVIAVHNTDNYPLKNPYVPGNLSASIYTDKSTYQSGDTMQLGLNATNPDSVKYVCFAIWATLPDSSVYIYMHEHSVILPIGTTYSNPAFDTINLPSIPAGTYTWHAAFLERGTHTIIVEDTAEWEFI